MTRPLDDAMRTQSMLILPARGNFDTLATLVFFAGRALWASAAWGDSVDAREMRVVAGTAHALAEDILGRPVQEDIRAEYDRARVKHPGMTLDEPSVSDLHRSAALIEEIGEVARCMTYDHQDEAELAKELIQVSMLAYSWVLLLDRQQAGEVSNG